MVFENCVKMLENGQTTKMQNFAYVLDNHYLSKIIGSVHALIN